MSRLHASGSAPFTRSETDLLTGVFETHPAGMSITHLADGMIAPVNQEFARLTGYGREAIGRTTAEIGLWVRPEERTDLVAALELTGTAEHRSTAIRTGRGEVVEVRFSARVIEHEGETYLLAVLEDTTQEELAHEELRRAEAKFRTLVEAIPAVVYIDAADDSMMTTYISPQIEALLGVTPEEYVSDPELWVRHLHPEDRERTVREYDEGRRSGRPYSLEYRMIRTDDRTVWLRDEVSPVLDQEGRSLLLQGISYDITDVKMAEEAVRHSEALLRATIESTTDGILVVGPDGRTLYANERFAEMWRIPSDMLERRDDDEMLAYVLDQLVEPEVFLQKVRELYAVDDESFDTIPFKDGRTFERFSRPLLQDGRNVGRVWSFRDVTDRHRAEEQLRESEKRYRTLVERMPAVVYVETISDASSSVFTSPQIRDLLGYGPEDWGSQEFWDSRIHPEDHARVLAQVARSNATGQPFYAEYRLLARGERVVWVRDEAVRVELRADGTQVWQGVLVDLTERKEAERQLREAEARYRTLVEQIPAVLYVDQPDESLQTLYVSPQVEPILGVTAEEWVTDPHSWDRHLHPDDRERVLDHYFEFLRTGEMPGPVPGIEYRWVRPDGDELWLYDTAAFVRDERGKPLFLQGVMFDTTERKRAEEELRESLELLAKAHAERQLLLARLVAAQEEERQRIAADIHDDPIQKMTAVGLRLEAFKRRGGVEEPDRLLEELEKSVELAIGRLRHLMFELRPPELDRDGLAAALRQELDELAREEDLDVRLDDRLTSEPPPTTRTMAFRIAQEALVNARKHASARRIDVLLESRDEGLFVRVRDDGTGFTPAEGGSQPGHFGLTAMRERTETAGGWFRVSSSATNGTTVEFCLPLRNGES